MHEHVSYIPCIRYMRDASACCAGLDTASWPCVLYAVCRWRGMCRIMYSAALRRDAAIRVSLGARIYCGGYSVSCRADRCTFLCLTCRYKNARGAHGFTCCSNECLAFDNPGMRCYRRLPVFVCVWAGRESVLDSCWRGRRRHNGGGRSRLCDASRKAFGGHRAWRGRHKAVLHRGPLLRSRGRYGGARSVMRTRVTVASCHARFRNSQAISRTSPRCAPCCTTLSNELSIRRIRALPAQTLPFVPFIASAVIVIITYGVI